VRTSARVFTGSVPATATQAKLKHRHPLFRAPENVCGAGCAGLLPKRVCCFFDWGNIWESWLGNLGNLVLGNLRNRAGACCGAGQSVRAGQKVCRAYLLWSLVILPRLAPPYPWWSEGSPPPPAAAAAGQQQQQQRSTARTERARSPEPVQTFRTSRGRSRECRSPRAGPAG
jgi:hypothetical protein